MDNHSNPFEAPQGEPSTVSDQRSSRIMRFAVLAFVAFVGITIGGYISAELLYVHYPDTPRSAPDVLSNTIVAVLSSPLSMSIGVLVTTRFYGEHFLVGPGALLAAVTTVRYYKTGKNSSLAWMLLGFILWSHNNFLSFQAMMSV